MKNLRFTSLQRLVSCVGITIASIPALAQGTIPWANAAKQPAQLTSPTSPVTVVFNNSIYAYYCDQNSNQLYGGVTSSPSTNLSIFGSTGMSCGTASMAMNATVFNNSIYLASLNLTQGLLKSTDGHSMSYVNWHINSDTVYTYNYGIATFKGKLYIAYYGTHGSSVASSIDGVNFNFTGTFSNTAPSNPSSPPWTPGYSLLASDDGNTLYVAYTTTGGDMVVGHSTDGVNWSTQQFTNTFGHDPSLVNYHGAIYVLGQCVCNGHQLWGLGTYDGINFSTAVQYGATMNNSLSAVEFQGMLYTVFRSNFANDLWTQYTAN